MPGVLATGRPVLSKGMGVVPEGEASSLEKHVNLFDPNRSHAIVYPICVISTPQYYMLRNIILNAISEPVEQHVSLRAPYAMSMTHIACHGTAVAYYGNDVAYELLKPSSIPLRP
eukprot:1362112-Rhodomonas_salina.3